MKKIALIILLLFPSISQADITTGLVGWWKFDEGSGNPADSSGGGFNGTLVGNATYTTGKIGPFSMTYDGNNDYVQVATAPTVTMPFTQAFWLYPKDITNNQGLIVHGLSAGGNGIFLFGPNLQILQGGNFRVYCGHTVTSGELNSWHHMAVVVNSSTDPSLWKCYWDGADAGVSLIDNSGYADPGTTDWTIGAYYNNSYWLNGFMDEVRVYSRSLSAGDVAELYAYTGAVVSNSVRSVLNGNMTVQSSMTFK
jgi:hypothetical protein